jgi:UDP-3-O-[3-hydroxymyristoyl] glucosamine N-acyltransferase
VSPQLVPSDRGPGLHVEPGVVIPDDTEIAPYVTIYGGVEIGAGVTIEQGAIVGRAQQLARESNAPRRPAGDVTVIGDGCRIGSGTVVVAGARLGAGTYVGDVAAVREGAVIGRETMIGRGCVVTHSVEIGDRVRVQTGTIVGQWTVLEDDAFVGAAVVFVGGRTLPPGPTDVADRYTVVRRGARIASGVIVIPPCEIGEEAIVGAGALVRGDVPARTVVAGNPAAPIRPVAEHELLDGRA